MSLTENTVRRTDAPQLRPYHFKPGQPSANPNGRPLGSRNKICEAYLAAMHADFVQHGVSVIELVREKKPEVYLACIAALVPKQKQEINSPFTDLSDEELNELEKFLKASRAKNVTPDLARSSTEQSLNTSPIIEQSEPPTRAATQSVSPTSLSDEELSRRLDAALNSKDRA